MMNNQRITAQSKANIQAAERAELVTMDDRETIRLWNGEKSCFVCGKYSVLLYPTANDARRAIKRIRPDLELTSFE
jgi:hypothetical protein